MIASTITISVSYVTINPQADMADADKQKEMDAKKAEVGDLFIILVILVAIIVIINAIKIMILVAIKIMILVAIKIMIIIGIKIVIIIAITIDRCGQGWRLRLQGRRTRRVS